MLAPVTDPPESDESPKASRTQPSAILQGCRGGDITRSAAF